MPSLLNNEKSAAQKFVDRLLDEGNEVSCDETNENFFRYDELPPFYDEKLFRKGQDVFNKHIFALFFAKLQGLLAILAVPTILRILVCTKMSGSDLTAYKRYMATIFHMIVWYQSDFKPGSRSWKSLSEVRKMHNSASKKSCAANTNRISQKDMALTQFGFMGFSLTKAEQVGIHNVSEDEWKAFLHVWRVVGYLMGIEDRFNLCHGSVQHTKEICNLLIDQVFFVEINKKDKDFVSLAHHLLRGMWALSPMLGVDCFMTYLQALVKNTRNINFSIDPVYLKLSFAQKLHVRVIELGLFVLKFDVLRIFYNYTMHLSLWLMKVFPFLAYYMFGIADSHVSIKI